MTSGETYAPCPVECRSSPNRLTFCRAGREPTLGRMGMLCDMGGV